MKIKINNQFDIGGVSVQYITTHLILKISQDKRVICDLLYYIGDNIINRTTISLLNRVIVDYSDHTDYEFNEIKIKKIIEDVVENISKSTGIDKKNIEII